MSSSIVFTTSAASKVHSLILDEENPLLNLRVGVIGGGCSGFQYTFTFDETINPDDTIITQKSSDNISEVKLLIDSMSFQYLKNAEIDYVENLQGSQFVIRNPNALTTCGCGSSFSLADEEEEG
jgi:iron-sulfur cluster insertion protein